MTPFFGGSLRELSAQNRNAEVMDTLPPYHSEENNRNAPDAVPCETGAASGSSRLVYPSITQGKASDFISIVLADHCRICGDTPVVGVRRFLKDVIVKKQATALFQSHGRPPGSVIREFSHQSRYKLLHVAKNCGVPFRSMVTATYPKEFPRDGRQVKNDLNRLNQWFRDNFEQPRGIWFLEFQKRGAPHFHHLLDIDLDSHGHLATKRRTREQTKNATYRTCPEMEQDLSRAWYRIVSSGDEKHLRAGICWEVLEDSDAAAKYAAKHAAKPRQKEVPDEYLNVGRFWGVIGRVKAVALDEDFEKMTTTQLFKEFGHTALSNNGRVKKYLWDASRIAESLNES